MVKIRKRIKRLHYLRRYYELFVIRSLLQAFTAARRSVHSDEQKETSVEDEVAFDWTKRRY